MIRATGLGPLPAGDPLESQLGVIDELTSGVAGHGIGLPFEAQVASATWEDEASVAMGRACSLLDQAFTERGTHGWKLTERPGRDLRAAQHRVTEGLDALAIALAGYEGPLTVGSIGPVTFASKLYLARGDRVLSDLGAVREVAHSLAEGLADHLAAIRRVVPGVTELTVQLDESMLGAAIAGVIPNFSGMFRIRALAPVVADEVLRAVIGRVSEPVVIHLGPSTVGLDVVRGCPIAGVGLALGNGNVGAARGSSRGNGATTDEARWHQIAEMVEAGTPVWWGMPAPALSQCAGPQLVGLADQLWRPWRQIGLAATGLSSCVLIDNDRNRPRNLTQVRDRLASLVRVAEILAERSQG